jgi:hypothetical protein
MPKTLGQILGPPGSRLYHYTTRERALEYILNTGEMRVGPFETMNDPREAMDWTITMVRTTGHATDAVRSARDSFNRALKRRSKVVCFTQDGSGRAGSALERGWAHPRMWAQYAGDHSGVCLFFDRKKLTEKLDAALAPHGVIYKGPVDYTNDSPAPKPGIGLALDVDYTRIVEDGMDPAVSRHLAAHHRDLFFTKLQDWSDEQEFRFIVFGVQPDPILVRVAGALLAVCVGWRFHSAYEPALSKLTGNLGVQALRCEWENGYPAIGLI